MPRCAHIGLCFNMENRPLLYRTSFMVSVVVIIIRSPGFVMWYFASFIVLQLLTLIAFLFLYASVFYC